jgi:hypothetical protein
MKAAAARISMAATVSGSRTFANSFVVKWTPNEQNLKVEITGGGTLLTINNFTPDNSTQPVDGSSGTFSVVGTLVALYNADGLSGTLISLELVMTANSIPSKFKGAIGTW